MALGASEVVKIWFSDIDVLNEEVGCMCAASGARQGSESVWQEKVLLVLVLSFLVVLPVSISLAQPLGYLAIMVWLLELRRTRDFSFLRSPFLWPFLLFSLLLIGAALVGPQTGYSLPRTRRLVLASMMFVLPSLFGAEGARGMRSLFAPVVAFLIGTTLLGLWDLIRIPMEVRCGIGLYDTGNMRDPQLYLVGACMLLALWIYRPLRCRVWLLCMGTALHVLGLILHFKRGVWISFGVAILLIAGLTRKYRIIAFLLLGGVALCAVPQTRGRLELLREEFSERTGGRRVLWTQVAPRLIQQYPLGAGFRSLEHETLTQFADSYVQEGLNHLHNNLLQVTVDAGWLGGGVWLYWMLLTLFLLIRMTIRYQKTDPALAAIGLACAAGFTGLMVNGLVEYNFGNSVVFMVLVFLMGLTNVLYRRSGAYRRDQAAQ